MAKLILNVTWAGERPEDGTRSGKITILLLAKTVPKTSAHFLNLAKSGAYSQNAGFYRVGKEFMVQGGLGKGAEKIRPIEDEFTTPLIENRAGTVSVANRGPNTGSSEFFINVRGWKPEPGPEIAESSYFQDESQALKFLTAKKADPPWNHWLDGKHPVFGVVADDDELDFVKELSEISLRTPGSAGAPAGAISMQVSFSDGNDEADEKRALEFLGLAFEKEKQKENPKEPKEPDKKDEGKKEPAWRKFF